VSSGHSFPRSAAMAWRTRYSSVGGMSNPNQAAAEGGSVIAHAVADFVTDAGTVRHCLLTHCRSRHPPQVTSRARLSGDPRAVLTHVSPEFAPGALWPLPGRSAAR
jgi:hypothetical protein